MDVAKSGLLGKSVSLHTQHRKEERPHSIDNGFHPKKPEKEKVKQKEVKEKKKKKESRDNEVKKIEKKITAMKPKLIILKQSIKLFKLSPY